MKRPLLAGIGITIGLVGLVLVLLLLPNRGSDAAKTDTAKVNTMVDASGETIPLSNGRFIAYDSALISAQGYNTTILFFHAPWCPECRVFEQALTNSDLPDGLQVLKVDYDSSTDLKQMYGVTIQSTFVRIDAAGAEQAAWVGYGKDKSIEAIVSNL